MSNIQKVEEDIARARSDISDLIRLNYEKKATWEIANQILNLTYHGYSIRQALETILTIKKDECLGKVDMFTKGVTLMAYPSPVKDL